MKLLVDNIRIKNSEAEIKVDDITLCLGIRISDVNPWSMDRLIFALSYYSPKPNSLVVDFGSKSPYSDDIKRICDEHSAEYIYVEDDDEFSASRARNIAFENSTTDFLFFIDLDFVYERDIFGKLASIANRLEMVKYPRKMIPMPIFHVNKAATQRFEELSENLAKDRMITEWSFDAFGSEFSSTFEFVAPYSNTFFISRKLFDLSGGYCDEFRGHGSEDFEFLIRLAKLSTNIPISSTPEKDFYGPMKDSFFDQNKSYAGFRRYLEAFTAPAESLGIKAFHLWHEKPSAKGYWTKNNDWRRERFNQVMGRHISSEEKILSVDYIKRPKKALCVFRDKTQWGYFIPLRLLGYKLVALCEIDDKSIHNALSDVENFEFDRVFIFNPYMKSHAIYRGILELAKKLNIKTTVIERGGLPNSIYYADEVAYGDSDYIDLRVSIENAGLQKWEIDQGKNIANLIRTGKYSLEDADSYEVTWKRLALLRYAEMKKIFIPLQLRDDMAVNYFTEGHTTYNNFEKELQEVACSRKDFIFIIKQHPLSKYDLSWVEGFENIHLAAQSDNVHALIDVCDAVIVYNSGVGLLALAHQKPVYCLGNAYYSGENKFAINVSNIETTLDLINTGSDKLFTEHELATFLAWLSFRKYSWFSAEDVIREFSDRKSHGYRNISVNTINIDGISMSCGNNIHKYPFSQRSYLAWKIGLGIQNQQSCSKSDDKRAQSKTDVVKPKQDAMKPKSDIVKNVDKKLAEQARYKEMIPTIIGRLFVPVLKIGLPKKKASKLDCDPYCFFNDSRFNSIKIIGNLCYREKT
ncbi:glycosyltransferase [Aeromonas veronii]|uniref:capsular polysaccharide export protein, LipB/KpsS family n=1 Tax=Aeromonas veronii TaxID=654 RepID=UPI003D19EE58